MKIALKRSLCIALTILAGAECVVAQKKALDHSTADIWPVIQSPAISNDGRFVSYSLGIIGKGLSFIVQAADHSWKKNLKEVFNTVFSNDNRKLIFMVRGDSLGILELGTENIKYISETTGFSMVEQKGGELIAYQKKDSTKALVLLNLSTGKEERFLNIDGYLFSKNGQILLLITTVVKNSISKEDIRWVDRTSGKMWTICKNCKASEFVFDEEGTGLAFLNKDQVGELENISLCYYRSGMDSARVLADSSTPGLDGMTIAESGIVFNKLGNRIFFKIEEHNKIKGKNNVSEVGAQVKISGIHDIELASELERGIFWASMVLDSPRKAIIRLQQKADKNGGGFEIDKTGEGNWAVTASNIVGDPRDIKWNIFVRPDIYLVSTRDGTRNLLKNRLRYYDMSFSPTGQYFIWFDQEQRQWYCHDMMHNRTKDITRSIGAPVYWEDDHPDVPSAPAVAGWLDGDKGVLVYGRNDIWEVDPSGSRAPINLTGGYGAKNNIRFRYLGFNKDRYSPIDPGDTLILSAFNLITKEDGFFRLDMGSRKLEKLLMSPHIYNYQGDNFCGGRSPGPVIKARNADVYLLSRMSETEYPNLYTTQDFQHLNWQTDLAPQKEYNWYTSELVHWMLPDGKPGQGILFKPENFDPEKKYPIIFYFYEKLAYDLHIFIHAELSQGTMSIPWFVSNGYLVFVPDIYFKIGHPGQSACDAVVSAAKYLSGKPWVDSKHMGLQGHSYGGFETNYIVSHSHLFAAAAPASGISDFVSSYGIVGTHFYEARWGRIGATLWQRPDLYIENSAIYQANKVTAAVLIMHTINDWICPYQSQGLQWYNDLHRLGKKAWLLTYLGEDHILYDDKNRLDYSIRLGQFFDFFLKGSPAPVWMTQGILPGKGMGEGLNLDSSDRKP